MDVSVQDFVFWSVLEKDFGTKFHSHIKNAFHMCSYNNASVFQTIGEADIDYVENYMRVEVPPKFHSQPENHDEMVHFYGSFVKTPSTFQFNRGERRFIAQIVDHVKKIVESEDLQHFQIDQSNMKSKKKKMDFISPQLAQQIENELVKTSIGQFFRKLPTTDDILCKSTVHTPNVIELKKSLFNKAQIFFEKYKDNSPENEFTESMVEVKILPANQIEASVMCLFCAETSQTAIKLYCRTAEDNKVYWVFSNIQKHIERFHVTKTKDKNKKQTNKPKTTTNSIKPLDAGNIQSKHSSSISLIDETEPVRGAVSKDTDKDAESKENKTSEDDAQFYEDLNERIKFDSDLLYTQVYIQNLKTDNYVAYHKERPKNFIVEGSKPVIRTLRIDPNGNCLFSSLTHQLFHMKINSEEHKNASAALRANVVEHILQNIQAFLHDLKGRLLDIPSDSNKKVTDDMCVDFVTKVLAHNGQWGGTETLKAVADIHKVNILIVRDDGSSSLGNHFDREYDRSLFICYRRVGREGHDLCRNHYDSVADISEEKLNGLVVEAMELEKQSIIFTHDLHSISCFEID